MTCHSLVMTWFFLWIMQVRPHSRFCFVSFEDCVSERLRGHWCQQHHRFVFLPGLWWEVRGSNHQQLGSHESIWDLQGHCQKCCRDNGQGLSRSNISIHFQQSPAEDDWRCWKSCWYFQCCWSFGLIELLLFSDFSGWEQNPHWRGRICAEAEAAADGCGFALVGRQTISRNHDSRKLA